MGTYNNTWDTKKRGEQARPLGTDVIERQKSRIGTGYNDKNMHKKTVCACVCVRVRVCVEGGSVCVCVCVCVGGQLSANQAAARGIGSHDRDLNFRHLRDITCDGGDNNIDNPLIKKGSG